jgi:S-adenosylmethionine:tRNA ribosyltransferase-isomerase
VRVADFDYELPEGAIARQPAEPRDSARLLVYDRAARSAQHRVFRELPALLRRGDLLVLNDTRVRPWRLCGRRRSGGRVECLLLQLHGRRGEGFVKPSARLAPGEEVAMEGGAVQLRLLAHTGGGRWTFEVLCDGEPEAVLERCGRAPLPPYIARDGSEDPAVDRARYQTVFARAPGAVAAPTAGLHFTPELLLALAAAGVATATVTLHVGEGTFAPVRAAEVEEHRMHAERYELPAAAAAAVAAARARGGRVVAVGTTSCRVLETCALQGRTVRAGAGESTLFLHPGASFGVVDALITNFHLPQSTLLMLVAAFAGRDEVLRLYRDALLRGYRFYSFGDAMLLV